MKRILVAPLDWGLGHASRCVPIIREFLSRSCEVFLAGSGSSLELLKAEFPLLPYFELPGYHPVYPSSGSMVLKMVLQIPKFMRVIQSEHKALNEIIVKEKIDLVISDNRYGCWSDRIPCAFITHQSNILMPKRFGWMQHSVRRATERMMKKFTTCWLPDFPGDRSLAGDLILFGSIDKSISLEFIGTLSRFSSPIQSEKKYDVMAIFSGPEPQRTILEDIVSSQLKVSGLRYFIVRGNPGKNLFSPIAGISPYQQIDFITGQKLQEIIEQSDVVIARSGYSTVMDLNRLDKKAIFIPTPGQTEQEYLAHRLMEKGISFYMAQYAFDLKLALEKANDYSGFQTPVQDHNLLKNAVTKILSILN